MKENKRKEERKISNEEKIERKEGKLEWKGGGIREEE